MYPPYSNWLNAISSTSVQETNPQLPSEIDLQSHWYSGGFGKVFTTTCGADIIIDYLGEWNRGAGPDFKECLIRINGIEKKGSIELDLSPAEWELHGHATNPAFNDVILHVSFGAPNQAYYCRTQQQQEVPQIHIQDLPQTQIKRENLTLPGYCADQFSEWTTSEITNLLKASARHRLSEKSQRLSPQIEAIGLHETLWQALATTLGYRPNSLAMRLLSQRLKADTVKHLSDEQTRLAAMLGTANFLHPDLHASAPPETQEYLQSLWNHWWRERDQFELIKPRHIRWKMHGQRPANHPHRRVASLALLWIILPKIAEAVKHPSAQGFKELESKLTGLQDQFWSHHYTLTSKRSERSLTLFGKDKFRELVSNFLLPIWYLYDQEAAFDYYITLKSQTKNEQVKRSLERLFSQHPEKNSFAKHTYQHQGLQQIYHDFCLRHGCLNCPFPKIS